MFADETFQVCFADHFAGVAVAVTNEASDEVFAGCSGYRVFSRGKDFGDPHDVGIVEARAEVVK